MATTIDVGQLLSAFDNQGFKLIPHTRAPCTDLFVRADATGFVHCEWTRDDGDYFVIFAKDKDKERNFTYTIDGGSFTMLKHEDNVSSRIVFESQEELLNHMFGNLVF